MMPKKFLEDDINKGLVINKKEFSKNPKLDTSKKFFFNKNSEEELIEIKNYISSKKESQISLTIIDFRIFDNNMSFEKVYFLIINKSPNKKLINYFKQMKYDSKYIEELMPTNLKDEYESFSINEKNNINLQYVETYIENINSSDKSKLILYMDIESNDMSLFLLLNFFKKLNNKSINKVTVLTNNSIICLLGKGMNSVILSEVFFTGLGVGLLPLEKSKISSKGLKWDLTDWETNFGSINLSTSNQILDSSCNIFVHYGCIAFTAEINLNKL